MKKLKLILICSLFLMCCACLFAACYGGCNHDYEFIETVAPTCTSSGYKLYICSKCGNNDKRKLDKLPHTIPDAQIDDVNHKGLCITCNDEIEENHVWKDNKCLACGYVPEYTANIEYYEISSHGEVEVYSVKSVKRISSTDLIIPAIYNQKPVVRIEAKAFENCNKIKSVYIPESISAIPSGIFKDCTALQKITVAENSEYFKMDGECLVDINNKSLLKGFNSSEIPADGSVTQIDDYAFLNCSSFIHIAIPDCVTKIGVGAFKNCTSLETVKMPSSLTELGYCAFEECNSLRSIRVPQGVTVIPGYAFNLCSALQHIWLPDGLTDIGDSAFNNCNSLAEIDLPEGLKSIGEEAFFHCSSLTEVKIPASVESIDGAVFKGCYSVESIEVSADNQNYFSKDNCLIEKSTKTLINGCNNSIVPTDGSVTKIGDSAFIGCSELDGVVISEHITEIGDYAFSGCNAITQIVIPQSVTKIGTYAFADCLQLKSIEVADSVTKVGSSAFSGSNIESAKIPYVALSSVSKKNLKYLQLTTGEKIESYNFTMCSKLETLILPDTLKTIESTPFDRCEKLRFNEYKNGRYLASANNPYFALIELKNRNASKVEVHKDTKVIGDWAFSHEGGIKSVTLPEGLVSLGRIFESMSGIKEIKVPASVTVITEYAFRYCDSLTSVEIPSTMQRIEEYSFQGCTSLEKIYFKGTVAQWNAIDIQEHFDNITVYCTDGTFICKI